MNFVLFSNSKPSPNNFIYYPPKPTRLQTVPESARLFYMQIRCLPIISYASFSIGGYIPGNVLSTMEKLYISRQIRSTCNIIDDSSNNIIIYINPSS